MKGLLITYALTYGGAAVSLFRPFYGFLIYVAFSILRPESLWYWSVPQGRYSLTIAIALLVGWAIHGFGNWRLRSGGPILWVLLAYLAWQVLSGLQAANQAVAWRQIELQAKIILPFAVGLSLVKNVKDLKQLAWVIALTMGYVAMEANFSYWAGNNWLARQGFASMDNNSICIGMVAAAGLSFFLGLGETIWWRKLIAFAAAAFMAHAPMFGDSRGGMLGLAVMGVISFFLIRKTPGHYLAFGLAAAAAYRLAGERVVERFSTVFADEGERDASAQSRVDLWMDCWDMMQKHPIFGLGPDHMPLNAASYGWPAGKECHSVWFNAGAELGFVGLALLLSFYLLAVRQGIKLIRTESVRDPWFADVGRMVVAAICGFLVSATFVSLDNLEPPYYIVLLIAGAAKLAPDAQQARARDLNPTEQNLAAIA